MKTILTFVGGGDRDRVILQTAFAAAIPLSAHLDFLHVHVSAAEAASLRYSHAEFASGAALRDALEQLKTTANAFSHLAAENVREFCASAKIELCETPINEDRVTASFREEQTNTLERLTFHACHSDLIVMGRVRQKQGLVPHTLMHLVLNSGRPILVAASAAPQTLTGTILVCWKEPISAARAVTAATPILARARRVVFASVAKRDDSVPEALEELARQVARSGVAAEVRVIRANRRGIPSALAAAAEEYAADLVVMGAYGRSRARAIIFGSCTEAVLDASDRPILLMH